MIQLGIDRLVTEVDLQKKMRNKKLGLLAHAASYTGKMVHTLDALKAISGFEITCAFGPQHGMRGEKQYNMIESEDYIDPIHQIPVFSLYGKTRRPLPEMLNHCDGVLVDLQDVGCRIYTYLTTVLYVMEECAKLGKFVCILDRPNPAGRAIEGSILKSGNESFVGAGPILMRHGMTLGEMAIWMKSAFKKNFVRELDLEVIPLKGYGINSAPGYGWPIEERAWLNPSPNIPSVSAARVYSGAVMFEGTTLSEGRGTTRPFEGFGAPDIDGVKILKEMERLHHSARSNGIQTDWLAGCLLRPFYFEPTFYKHHGKLCSGVQWHVDFEGYDPDLFKPYRLVALALKATRMLYPDYSLWRDFPYEYVTGRLAIDVITGCETLRKWVDDSEAELADLESFLASDEKIWKEQTRVYQIYK